MTKQQLQEYVDELETAIAETYEEIRDHDLSKALEILGEYAELENVE